MHWGAYIAFTPSPLSPLHVKQLSYEEMQLPHLFTQLLQFYWKLSNFPSKQEQSGGLYRSPLQVTQFDELLMQVTH